MVKTKFEEIKGNYKSKSKFIESEMIVIEPKLKLGKHINYCSDSQI